MKIRFLDKPDLKTYRAMRFRSLKEEPTSFITTYADEKDLSLEEFGKRFRPHGNPENGIFGAFVGRRLVGSLGYARDSRISRAHIGLLWSMYVVPEFRGRGIGAALLDEAIAYARGLAGIRQLQLGVTVGNEAASALYRSRGFKRFGLERDALCVGGLFYDEEHLVLKFRQLKKARPRA